ncbi:MAG TPA: Hsp70 family protein [Sedimentisphaerales bacterium]|nr:Hsp70 family protein [Sedimentisphaerales bacterium]HRS11564.1 Hsp70 family protein [Sedimentisphaerales bacterium]HRV48184.1 Hsp70 family protein [Sedimentisphaerales bacterium]
MDNHGVLSIDFGTTNSYYCKCPADQIAPVGVDFGTGRDGLPTAILYRGDREPLVGEAALHEFGEASAQERRQYRLCTQFKPDIARSAEAADTAADFLRTVIAQARRQHIALDPAHQHVIFGMPSESQGDFRTALTEVARKAGYGQVRLLDEPKGALLYHLWRKDFSPAEAQRGILVVDFGGGTCDFAFLQSLRVTCSWGDMELGGRLFDDLFFQWFCEQNPGVLEELQETGDAYYVHSYLCREVKEFFSLTMARDRSETVNKSVGRYGSLRGMDWPAFMERASHYVPSSTLVNHLQGMGVRCRNVTQRDDPIDLVGWFRRSLVQGLSDEAVRSGDISLVVLAGGSSQWPFVADVVTETLSVDPSRLLRSDRPYAVIAQGLAILPALQKQFERTRETLRADLPQFCRNRVRPLVERVTGMYVSDVATDVTSEVFDKSIRPVLEDFRDRGGSVSVLRETISANVKADEDRLKEIIEERMRTLSLGLPGQLNELLADWFGSYGLSVGDKPVGDGRTVSVQRAVIGPEAPDLYGGIMETVGWFVVGLATSIGAMICGGAGTALVTTGPVGLLAGALLSAVAAFLAVRYGKTKARELADNWNAPAWVVRTVMTSSRIARARQKFKSRLEETLRRETGGLQDQMETRIREITAAQIEGLSEITQL